VAPALKITGDRNAADDGEFAYTIRTEDGAHIRVKSTTDDLRDTFTTQAKAVERNVSVGEGKHTITVVARDGVGNETIDDLTLDIETPTDVVGIVGGTIVLLWLGAVGWLAIRERRRIAAFVRRLTGRGAAA